MTVDHLVIIALAACELRWRFPWLRILLVAVAAVELQLATAVGPAYRRAVAHPQRMVIPAPPSRPPQLASDFVSGVLVMRAEAERDLPAVNFPLGILVWLALYPVVLPAVLGRLQRRERKQTSDVPA